MEPLGLLGALLGGYQQGRLSKQNRDIKSATLLRQQQENEALKKYRADSLELQKRRLDNEEEPHIKTTRDLFTGALKGLNDDFNKEVTGIQQRAATAADLESGMSGVYNKYNSMFKGLRAQHAASPTLAMLGDFDTLATPYVPDWVRSETFDKTRYPRPYFNPKQFQADMTKAVEEMTGRGYQDPDSQFDFLNSRVLANAELFGMDPEQLWKSVPYTRPGTPMQGKTLSVQTSPSVQTNVVDPSIGPFETKNVSDGSNRTTSFSHSTPANLQSLPAFKAAGQQGLDSVQAPVYRPNKDFTEFDTSGYKPPTSDALANEMMVEDLHYMFSNPNLRGKFGLTDVTDPEQFKRAIQIYMSPAGQRELQGAYNIADNFGANLQDGSRMPFYDARPYGNFGQSAQGQKIADQFRQAPLTSQTSTLVETPVTQRYAIPLTSQDRMRDSQIATMAARMPGIIASGELMQSKLEVQRATTLDQIAAPALRNMLSAMRLTLEPAKYLLAKAGFDLKRADTNFDNAIASGRLTLDEKKFIVDDAGRATRALLQSADANLKNASFNLSGAFQTQLLTSGIFDSEPSIKNKIQNGLELTPEEIKKVRNSIPLNSDIRVKRAIEAYDAALDERDVAYKAQKSFADLGIAFAKVKPGVSISAPGKFNDPFEDFNFDSEPEPTSDPGVAPEPAKPKLNSKGVVVDENNLSPRDRITAASKAAAAKPVAPIKATPPITNTTTTPGAIISAAQKKLSTKPATSTKPKVVKPAEAKKEKSKVILVNKTF